MIGIYKIENLINGKVYIGQSIDIEKRWRVHKTELNNNKRVGSHLQNAWNKYEEENFKFEVIEECLKEELNKKEKYWIAYYKNNAYGVYNLTDGGDGIKNPDILTRYKMSIARLGKPLSDLTKQRISAANKGKPKPEFKELTKLRISNAHKGKHTTNLQKESVRKEMKSRWQTSEWRQKISDLHKGNSYALGYKHTPEEIEKIRKASLGRVVTEETRNKISKARLGKPLSEEHRRKAAMANVGRIWITNEINSKMIYPYELSNYLSQGYVQGRIYRKESD